MPESSTTKDENYPHLSAPPVEGEGYREGGILIYRIKAVTEEGRGRESTVL